MIVHKVGTNGQQQPPLANFIRIPGFNRVFARFDLYTLMQNAAGNRNDGDYSALLSTAGIRRIPKY